MLLCYFISRFISSGELTEADRGEPSPYGYLAAGLYFPGVLTSKLLVLISSASGEQSTPAAVVVVGAAVVVGGSVGGSVVVVVVVVVVVAEMNYDP